MIKGLLITGLYAVGATESIPLVTFDGAKGSEHTFKEQNDPVMGGKSTGTFTLQGGVGIFDGEVNDIPFLKAPGFIKTTSVDSTAFPDISACSAIDIEAKSDVAFAGFRLSFGSAKAPGGKMFAYGYKSKFSPTQGSFGTVSLPLTSFTDYWDDATGNPIKTCSDDKTYCPDKATLQNLKTVSVWAEGVKGKVHLEIKSISASGCPAKQELKASGKDVTLVTFDGAKGTSRTFKEQNDPVMGGKSTGTFTVQGGLGIFDGDVVDVPFLKAPGFIKAVSVDSFPDISSCTSIDLVAKSDSAYAGYRLSFGTAKAPGGKFFSSGYKANFLASSSDFSTVSMPLSNFTDDWDDATGNPVKTCHDDQKYCPDKATLQDIKTLSVWAEGVNGKVHLEIKSISASGCAATQHSVSTPNALGAGRTCPAIPTKAKECPFKNISDPEFEPVCVTRIALAEIQQRRCMPGEKAPYFKDAQGVFRCACCGAPLWKPDVQFDQLPATSWPWPSFHSPPINGADGQPNVCHRGQGYGIAGGKRNATTDLGLGAEGEVGCARCGAHLGDYFNSKDDGMDHYCINGVCMEPPGGKAGSVCTPTTAVEVETISI